MAGVQHLLATAGDNATGVGILEPSLPSDGMTYIDS
jgi:hypothetical protein